MTRTAPFISTSAKAIIIRANHLLVIVKRFPEGLVHILPGGAQHHGEPLDEALQRECLEEIGTQIKIERLRFVREYIGQNHEHADTDSELHIVECLFACSIPEDYQAQLGPDPDFDQKGVAWLPIANLEQYRFYPASLKQILMTGQVTDIYLGDVN